MTLTEEQLNAIEAKCKFALNKEVLYTQAISEDIPNLIAEIRSQHDEIESLIGELESAKRTLKLLDDMICTKDMALKNVFNYCSEPKDSPLNGMTLKQAQLELAMICEKALREIEYGAAFPE